MGCNCRKVKLLKRIFGSNEEKHSTVYLDYAASNPPDLRTIAEFENVCRSTIGNPSSFHHAGLKAAEVLESSRENIASYLLVKPENVYFCSGGTQALNAAIYGLIDKKSRLISTKIEHSAVIKPILHYSKKIKHPLILQVDKNGKIDLDFLKANLTPYDKNIFVYSPVNHETGSLQYIKEIYQIIKENNGFVIIDGVQTISKLAPNEWVPYCDFIALSSHKIYAPKGSGLLISKSQNKLRPSMFGGNQENGLFAGTPNLPGIAAFSKSISILKKEFNNDKALLTGLTKDLIFLLSKCDVDISINSPISSVPGILNISIPSIENIKDFLIYLTNNNISVSRFSACTKNISSESKVLHYMGVSKEISTKSIRISMGRWSKRDDIYRLLDVIKNYMKKELITSNKLL